MGRIHDWNFATLDLMNTKNNCLGRHLPLFKHCKSEVALDF